MVLSLLLLARAGGTYPPRIVLQGRYGGAGRRIEEEDDDDDN